MKEQPLRGGGSFARDEWTRELSSGRSFIKFVCSKEETIKKVLQSIWNIGNKIFHFLLPVFRRGNWTELSTNPRFSTGLKILIQYNSYWFKQELPFLLTSKCSARMRRRMTELMEGWRAWRCKSFSATYCNVIVLYFTDLLTYISNFNRINEQRYYCINKIRST